MESKHIINQDITLLEALSCINSLAPEPLVLFIVDENQRMVGTLTDGDSRRALIAGASVNDKAEKVMHSDFHYMRFDDVNNVIEIRRQKEMKMISIEKMDESARLLGEMVERMNVMIKRFKL